MVIDFKTLPASTKVPSFLTEVDDSLATLAAQKKPHKILAIGQRTSAGTVAELVPKVTRSVSDSRNFFGRGSVCHGMARALFENNTGTEITFVAQDDDAGGTAATGTLTVTGPATAAGNVYTYIAGRRIKTAVANADAQNDIATALAASINLIDNLPVTAAAATNVVTLTARNKGTLGNAIDVRLNFQDGESTPAGVSVAIVAMSGGATDPDVADVWAALGETQYDTIVMSYTNQANLTAANTEAESRFGVRQIPCVVVSGQSDTVSNLATLGAANATSKHLVLWPQTNAVRPPWEFAAAIGGILGREIEKDPARQMRSLVVQGIEAPVTTDQYTFDELETLLGSGIAGWSVNAAGQIEIERVVTTFQTDSNGSPSEVYLDVTTNYSLIFMRWSFPRTFRLRYGRHKLAGDGNRFGPNQEILTPALGKAEGAAILRTWESEGIVENVDTTIANLAVERDNSDKNRLNFRIQPDLVNNARVMAAQFQFLI